jgi:hypothetical protein
MSQFLNNMSWLAWLMVIMCLIGLAAFCVWLLVWAHKRKEEKEKKEKVIRQLYYSKGEEEWYDNLMNDAYLRQQDKIDKVYEEIKNGKL